MDEQTQKISLNLSPQAGRYVQRDAPRETRLMAARGALPLQAVELATVLFALTHDPDAEVKTTARESLETLPDNVTDAVLGDAESHPALLSFLASHYADDGAKLERIALNPSTSDSTIALLAALPHKNIVDIVSNNQERMLRDAEIVDALGSNPLTGRSVLERILGFLGAGSGSDGEGTDAEAITDDEAEAALRAVLGESMGEFAGQFVADSGEELDDLDDLESAGVYQLIQKMTVFQKIQLARLGNKEARGLLVRDRNKLVAMAVIMSPKITDSEILTIAQSRSVSDDVMRLISRGRDWTKNYQVKLALTSNPKCPQPIAMQFVNYLQDRDLRLLMRSRDIPQAISTHARRILMKKGKL